MAVTSVSTIVDHHSKDRLHEGKHLCLSCLLLYPWQVKSFVNECLHKTLGKECVQSTQVCVHMCGGQTIALCTIAHCPHHCFLFVCALFCEAGSFPDMEITVKKWLTGQWVPRSCLSPLPQYWDCITCHHTQWVQGIELRLSWLQGKYFSSWAFSPSHEAFF